MPARLIVNADDFGLTRGINCAVAELYDAGALTSTTLMASGPAFDDAVRIARKRPGLGVGCHIVLTDGVPVSAPGRISSLLASDRRAFRPKLWSFAVALLTNQIDPGDIEREAIAQIRRVQDAGITVTHLDAHKHTHILPQVLRPLLRAAAQTGVHAIRNPFEQPWAFPLSNGSVARTSQFRVLRPLKQLFAAEPAIRSGQIRSTNGTVGVSATGNLDQQTLRSLLTALPDGTWELVCHPGYNDADLGQVVTRLRESRDVERIALLELLSTKARSEFVPSGQHLSRPDLIHYGSLVNDRFPPTPEKAALTRRSVP